MEALVSGKTQENVLSQMDSSCFVTFWTTCQELIHIWYLSSCHIIPFVIETKSLITH